MVVTSLRNGFGFDVEIVDNLPVWAWKDSDAETEPPDGIAEFEGMVFNIPFLKIMVGKVVGVYE